MTFLYLNPTPVQPLPSGVVPSTWTPNGVPPPQQQQQFQAPPPQHFQQQQPQMGMSGGYPPQQPPPQMQQQQQPPPPMNNMQASNGFGQPPPSSQPKAASSKSGPMGSSFFDSVKGLFTPGPDPALLKKKVRANDNRHNRKSRKKNSFRKKLIPSLKAKGATSTTKLLLRNSKSRWIKFKPYSTRGFRTAGLLPWASCKRFK